MVPIIVPSSLWARFDDGLYLRAVLGAVGVRVRRRVRPRPIAAQREVRITPPALGDVSTDLAGTLWHPVRPRLLGLDTAPCRQAIKRGKTRYEMGSQRGHTINTRGSSVRKQVDSLNDNSGGQQAPVIVAKAHARHTTATWLGFERRKCTVCSSEPTSE